VWQDVFEDNENVHLVMELCSGGPILERVKAGKMSERDVATIIRSVLRFIAQCHSRGIIYRDVKPDNFLFLTTEPESPIRATDFGLSIRCAPNPMFVSSCPIAWGLACLATLGEGGWGVGRKNTQVVD
jgi:calcium-dependent protein kinase